MHFLLHDLTTEQKLKVQYELAKQFQGQNLNSYINFVDFGSFWWFCPILISTSQAAQGIVKHHHMRNITQELTNQYPRTNKSRPNSNSMFIKFSNYPISDKKHLMSKKNHPRSDKMMVRFPMNHERRPRRSTCQ